jgi:putative MATE family efflux protein
LSHSAVLTKGPVGLAIARLAGPMSIGLLSVLSMNAIDAFFVGRLGKMNLAAISFTFPVVAILGTVALGLGIGVTSVLSRLIGQGEQSRVKRVATDSLILSLIIVSLLSTIGLMTVEPLFMLLGSTEDTLPLIVDYISIWYTGMVFLVVPMVGNAVMRSTGDAVTPAKIMVLAALINFVLDPVCIFGMGPIPPMGISGAAAATVFARAFAAILSLWWLNSKFQMLSFNWPGFRALFRSWKEVLSIGGPAVLANAVSPVTMALLTVMVSSYGEASVAAFGAGGRIYMVCMVVPIAIGSAMAPFVGQNWGAELYSRSSSGISFAQKTLLIWGVFLYFVLAFASPNIAMAFTEDPDVYEDLRLFLWVVPVGMGMHGIAGAMANSFNAINRPYTAAFLTVFRTMGLSVPLAWYASSQLGLVGIFIAMAASDTIAGIAGWWLSRRILRNIEIEPTRRNV